MKKCAPAPFFFLVLSATAAVGEKSCEFYNILKAKENDGRGCQLSFSCRKEDRTLINIYGIRSSLYA
jgi:hypothetical protein